MTCDRERQLLDRIHTLEREVEHQKHMIELLVLVIEETKSAIEICRNWDADFAARQPGLTETKE